MPSRKLLLPTLLLIAACGAGDANPLPAQGQWRLVNYWALWCTPCREEIPELNLLDKIDGITVFGVNYDGKRGDELQEQRRALGINFPALTTDPAGALGIARPRVLPTTLIVNPDGVLVATLAGPQTEASLLEALETFGR